MTPARAAEKVICGNSKTPHGPEILVGTSGYSYGEWVDSGFYPAGTHSADMLPRYAGVFRATELNYTWYQMPKAPAMERMCSRVDAGFRFAAKLTRTLTHEVRQNQWKEEARQYCRGIAPLKASGRLLCVLIQLPPYFRRTPESRQYLAALLDELTETAGLPLAVEFRHDSWVNEKVFSELERRRVTLVTVDCPRLPPLFPRLDRITNPDLFYVRFHGRNCKGWGSGSMQHQFDYNYSDPELEEWTGFIARKLSSKASRGALFFNNHVRGQAPANARKLISLLEKSWNDPSST
ncbi:DUF72 domain-containing protein [Desulfospira joergensenii]|uniref:DUF72 domain-containing protein n=1 Tax=Desulfospira joergensenii TaxID=53329 RepID=UPI0003B694FA|nr:DUF72 domain-containing protein [Desulfospira joergensenii]